MGTVSRFLNSEKMKIRSSCLEDKKNFVCILRLKITGTGTYFLFSDTDTRSLYLLSKTRFTLITVPVNT